MKRVAGSAFIPANPNSGAPIAVPVDSAAFDTIVASLDAIQVQLKLTNALLMEIGK